MKNLLSILRSLGSFFPRKRTLTEEEDLERTAALVWQSSKIMDWMQAHFNDIFAAAPEDCDYAVGVYRAPPTKPEIYYFKHRDKEALPFFAEVQKKGKGAYCMWRCNEEAMY